MYKKLWILVLKVNYDNVLIFSRKISHLFNLYDNHPRPHFGSGSKNLVEEERIKKHKSI